MSTPLPSLTDDLLTVDDFYACVEDGRKADLIDGVIYMASPDSPRANDLNTFLCALLRMYVQARQLGGTVYVNRVAFELTLLRAPEPDLAYVRPERMNLVTRRGVQGAPDLAVEIVSRDSRTRDYVEKKQLYQDAGVSEYWIIDAVTRHAEFWRLTDGRYDLVRLERNAIFRSEVLPGFWLDVDWLVGDSLPNEYDCLRQLLADD
jgi:Uma2 family endonuclease